MANLKEVKTRIKSVTSTQQITKAMKMVAAAKLRRAQDNLMELRPYAQRLTTILQRVSSGMQEDYQEDYQSAYETLREETHILIIAITSDKGLCGGFNSNVFKSTTKLIAEKYQSQADRGNVTILPIGKRSLDYYKRHRYPVHADFGGLFTGLSFDSVREAAQYAMEEFVRGTYDKVELVYNEFKNVATQLMSVEQFLPILPKTEATNAVATDYIYLPSQEVIAEKLIPESLKIQLYKAVLESNAAEHGARMTAMDKATDNAGELLKELKLSYNRTRQGAITTEILEIVAGAEALG